MGNEKVRQQKEVVVNEVAEKLRASTCTVLADYRGVNVADVTRLRQSLREAGVEFRVIKNTMTRRATAMIEMTDLDEYLVGPTAIAFSNEDMIAPAKILSDFAKKNDKLKIKAGVLEGAVVSEEQIIQLANLPSREGLLSMLLSVLQAPMRNMALVVKAVADQRGETAQEA